VGTIFVWVLVGAGLVGGLVAPSMTQARVKSRTAHVVGWILWFLFAFVVSQFIVAPIIILLDKETLSSVEDSAIFQVLTYFVTFAMMLLLPWLQWKRQQKKSRKADTRRFILKLSGLDRKPTWSDVKQYATFFPLYFVTNLVAGVALTFIVGTKIMTQEQNIGFATTGQSPLSLVLIFFCLVILAPLFEEMLIRGALFSKIREKLKFWPTALLTAGVFALIHGQFNVGVMTFILALYCAYLREKTGAIWGGIMLHATQNLIAFCLLFLVK
jgi:membrane protease YdiL (CAAX protease family)